MKVRLLPLLLLAAPVPSSPAARIQATDSSPAAGGVDARAELEVRFLANEGFLLRAGEAAVAIDAFLAEPYSVYGALEGAPLDDLVDGTGPFAALDVVLASHVHRDHFQPGPARRFLAARPDCVLATSPQVIDALLEEEAEGEAALAEDALLAYLPQAGREARLERGGVRVDFLLLPHGTGRFASIENLGHLIRLGGWTALHVGDAAMDPETFAAYRLRARGIDVAFVPYWYFGDPAGLRIVDEHLRPARLVACHVPPAELERVAARFARSFPDVIVPRRPLERLQLADRGAR